MIEVAGKNKAVEHRDLGTIHYKDAWDYQQQLLESIVETKVSNRQNGRTVSTSNYLLFCEHPAVYSIGKSGDPSNLLISEEEMKNNEIEFYKTNRGGDITFHGPGQIVGYPILDLENFTTDIHKYLRDIEEVVIDILKSFGITSSRYEGFTGVWIDADKETARKICAIGVRTSRWVTMHGFALNVNTDLSYFDNIVPCGIEDKAVTSMQKELGTKQETIEVKKALIASFEKIFNMKILNR